MYSDTVFKFKTRLDRTILYTLVRLCVSKGSPDPSLISFAISTYLACVGIFLYLALYALMDSCFYFIYKYHTSRGHGL